MASMDTLVNFVNTIVDSKNGYNYIIDANADAWSTNCVVTLYEEPKLRFEQIDLSEMLKGVN